MFEMMMWFGGIIIVLSLLKKLAELAEKIAIEEAARARIEKVGFQKTIDEAEQRIIENEKDINRNIAQWRQKLGLPTEDVDKQTQKSVERFKPPPSYYEAKAKTAIDASKWSPELLRTLEWKRFEDVCTEYFKLASYRVKQTDFGADGGVDVILYKNDKPFALVQCKARSKAKVGVKVVRELVGVMAVKGIKNGILMTNSSFTDDAIAFDKEIKASKKASFNLVNCDRLLKLIEKLPTDKQAVLLRMATYGDFQTPTCPRCGIKMVERHRHRDGGAFWGCRNYPRCRTVINIAR